MTQTQRLRYFPITFFSMIMGLSGFTLVLMQLEEMQLFNLIPTGPIALLTIVFFLVLATIYIAKAINHTDAVRVELNHPVLLSFFPTVPISLILIGTFLTTWLAELALTIWAFGAIIQLLLSILILSRWIHHDHFEIHHISPAWFIPVVGNILVPVAGVHNAPYELNWLFFSVGMLFWIVLFTIILYRMIFHHPLAENLLPTLFILIAPPAVGFISYLNLNPELDSFARFLYYSALFLTLLLLFQLPRLIRLPFSLSWWAYSFPLAAFTMATLLMFEETEDATFKIIGLFSSMLLSLLILLLLLQTFRAIRKHQICLPPAT